MVPEGTEYVKLERSTTPARISNIDAEHIDIFPRISIVLNLLFLIYSLKLEAVISSQIRMIANLCPSYESQS